ncbi:MAG: intradiol ring-cleavage dioxygenase [Saprospiraceae bacterium]|nr:intradiol ring-cleavage dioxygenase [Saprospiraceae bacterium]
MKLKYPEMNLSESQMIRTFVFVIIIAILSSCNQHKGKEISEGKKPSQIGGAFENREFTYYGIPRSVNAVDTSPGWHQTGQKLKIKGVIFKADGQTPAPGVLLYYYHTNTEGTYLHKPEIRRSMAPNDLGQTHGYIRGWVQTDQHGAYEIYTVRPGSYPGRTDPAHIHCTIKEPNDIAEYYIDDILFDDDPLLTERHRQRLEQRAGNGIVELVSDGELAIGVRNIVLGKNIPGYPL